MCLDIGYRSAKPRPKIAKQAIIVYKMFGAYYRNPFQTLRVDGKPEIYQKGYHYYKTHSFSIDVDHISINDNREYWVINGGAFHVLTKKGIEAGRGAYAHHLVKMYIPKGAEYFVDKYGQEIACNKLVYPDAEKGDWVPKGWDKY